MNGRRRMLTVRITDEARRAIDDYCARQGITVTAWVEAVGRRIQELEEDDAVDVSLRSVADDTVEIARRIDQQRRARLPRAPSGAEPLATAAPPG